MTDPDICGDSVELHRMTGLIAYLVCLLREGHSGSHLHERFDVPEGVAEYITREEAS